MGMVIDYEELEYWIVGVLGNSALMFGAWFGGLPSYSRTAN